MEGSDRSSGLPGYYERNDGLVIEAFRRGEFDYLEGVGEVSEVDFFRALTQRKVLQKLADTYPSPCQKHEVPLWVYIASDISMRFHGVHPFHAFPYVVRSGGLVQAFGPQMGHKAVHALAVENRSNVMLRDSRSDSARLVLLFGPRFTTVGGDSDSAFVAMDHALRLSWINPECMRIPVRSCHHGEGTATVSGAKQT